MKIKDCIERESDVRNSEFALAEPQPAPVEVEARPINPQAAVVSDSPARTDGAVYDAFSPARSSGADLVRRRRLFRRSIVSALLVADMMGLGLSFAAGNFLVYGLGDIGQLATVLAAALSLMLLFGLNDGAYSPRVGVVATQSILRAWKALSLTAAALVLVVFLVKAGPEFSRLQFIVGIALGYLLIAIARAAIAKVCSGRAEKGLFATLHIYDGVQHPSNGNGGLVVVASEAGLYPDPANLGAVERIGSMAKGMNAVVVHCLAEDRNRWASTLKALDVPGEIIVPELDAMGVLAVATRDGSTSLILSGGHLHWDQMIVKRAFDIVVSGAAIVALAPFLVGMALVICLDSKGPAFFKQERIGLGNRRFKMWKFRSMRTDLADAHGSKLTERNDPRVTRVGAFIRRTSIDELPQLFNVLRGDMSIVGPRPHPVLARAGTLLYWEVDETYWHRHVVKPGITGLAQVSGHRGNTFHEDDLRRRLGADLKYVTDWSLMRDIKILLSTFGALRGGNAF